MLLEMCFNVTLPSVIRASAWSRRRRLVIVVVVVVVVVVAAAAAAAAAPAPTSARTIPTGIVRA